MDVGTVEVGKAGADVSADDESGAGTDDDTTEVAAVADDAVAPSLVDDVADPHAASTNSDSTYARGFTFRRYIPRTPMTTLVRAHHRPRRRPIAAATRVAVALAGVAVLAGPGAGCTEAECSTSCAAPGVSVKWFPGDLPNGTDVTLCLDGDCARVEPVQVGGGLTVFRDHFSDKTIDVKLVATDATTGTTRTLTGSGRFPSGRCDCPGLALHVEGDRLER